jgi:hypothetical protein
MMLAAGNGVCGSSVTGDNGAGQLVLLESQRRKL